MTKTKSTKRALIFSALALIMCLSMFVGSTYAWFTDTVTSTNNIIKSGTLSIAMHWADGDESPENAVWQDASQGAIFNYDKWEPGYVQARHIKISNVGTLAFKYEMQITANGVVSKLANVIDVYFFDDAVQTTRASFTDANKVGTLADVLNGGAVNALTNTVKGQLLAEEGNNEDVITIAFKMRENAGNEYQGLSIGTDFSIRLYASQLSYEEDSFNNQYDITAQFPAQERPSAIVKALTEEQRNITVTSDINSNGEPIVLDTAYQFIPTETLATIEETKYANWHADFVVYADHKVPADSMMLAGYFKVFDDFMSLNGAWIGLSSTDDIAANSEVRLLRDGLSTSVNYTEICKYGNDGIGFLCGAVDLDGKNAGTTLTVELRLYETEEPSEANGNSKNVETGRYIVVGTFQYLFDESYDTSVTVTSVDELAAALENASGNVRINIGANLNGNVVITQPSDADSRIIIEGNGYKYDGQIQIHGNSNNATEDDSLVIRNLNFETGTEGREFIWSASSNAPARYAHNVTIENCTFTANGAAVHSAIGIKLQQAYDFNIKNCVATNMRTLLQAESCGATIGVYDCKVINGKNAVSFNNTRNAIIKNTEIEAVGDGSYGIRHKAEVNGYELTVENCKVSAFVPVLIRNATGSGYVATFNGTNTLTATNSFGYQVVVTAGDWDNDSSAPSMPSGNYTLIGTDNLNVFQG